MERQRKTEAFDYTDSYGSGRTRHFDEKESTVYQNRSGYFAVKLSGRDNGHCLVHRMVAEAWDLPKTEEQNQINHKDGDKGNNSVENLEWVTAKENMQHAFQTGLSENVSSLKHRYISWKQSAVLIPPEIRPSFKADCLTGMSYTELAEKYKITPQQANNVRSNMNNSEYEELFQMCYAWDTVIETLNQLQKLYQIKPDDDIFCNVRALLPQGFMAKATVQMNYEVLFNMYHARKFHRLSEWHDFCDWIKSLPYSEIITLEE